MSLNPNHLPVSSHIGKERHSVCNDDILAGLHKAQWYVLRHWH